MDLSQSSMQAQIASPHLRVAYIMSRFPKLTETFILFEMLSMQNKGVQIEVYPLQKESTSLMHPEAVAFVNRAHFTPLISLPILKAQAYFLLHNPGAYLGALWAVLRANFGSARYFFAALVFFPKSVYFARQMAHHEISHIHAHFSSHPAMAAYVINRLTGIPYSFTAHGSDLHRDQHMLREKVLGASAVIAISEYNRKAILGACKDKGAEKVHIIHCGVDTHAFRPAERNGAREGDGRPFSILCVGTLHEVKGQAYLIAACRQLADQGVCFRCAFVGDGPDRQKLTQQVAECGLTGAVDFHGQLPRDQVIKLMQQCDVVVAPSVPTGDGRREGIPVVLMEAMSCAAPVVASNLSGIPELVDDGANGLLVPPRDAAALAQALKRLYDHREMFLTLGRCGREKVRQEFDQDRNADRLRCLFLHGAQPCG